VDYEIVSKVVLTLRGGYFKPGVASQYLINGNSNYNKAAWELRGEVTFTF
jgi:hypothetical protein